MEINPIQKLDINPLLNDAIAEAHKWESTLGNKAKGKAEKTFEALKNGRLELGNPETYVQQLNYSVFEHQHITLSPEIEKSIQAPNGYLFYIVPFPILLFPGRGANYRLVESEIAFTVSGGKRAAAIHSVFPEPLWKPVLQWGGQLNLALDGNLQWGAEVTETKLKIDQLNSQLTGRVSNINEIGGLVRVMPFTHEMGRMEIEAQYSSTRAMWRLDSSAAIRSQKHVRLIVLLKVPKEVCQVQITAAAQAKVSFSWFTAQIEHIQEKLPESLKNFIVNNRGIPLQDFKTWTVNLPSC